MRGTKTYAVLVTSTVLLLACSPATDDTNPDGPEASIDDGQPDDSEADDPEVEEPVVEERVAVLSKPTSQLVAGDNSSEVSIDMSERLFESSPGAIVTTENLQLEAASLAAIYSVPVLVDGEGVVGELARLETDWVITVGVDLETDDDIEIIRTVLPVSAGDGTDSGADPGTEEDTESTGEEAGDEPTSEDPAEEETVTDGEAEFKETPEASPDLEPDPSVTVVEPEGEGIDALQELGENEAFVAPERHEVDLDHDIDLLEGLVVLTDGYSLAAVGTARAAGAEIIFSPKDPRASSEAITAASSTDIVLGLFEGESPEFEWQLATAATGVELPGGTQHVFEGKRYIALYGSPITTELGILGEQDVPSTIIRAEEMAEPYRLLTEDTIVPTQEIIVTVAAGEPGDDGNYSHEGAIDWFIPLIEAAGEADQYVVLDFQPGRSDFLSQIQLYEELLAYPHVGIALDPEWRLRPDEQPLTRIGHVEIAEVNEVIDYLADYVQDNNLPQKMVVLHQFQLQMIRDRDQLDLSRSEVALLIHADGQGSQPAKNATWNTLHQDAPEGVAWGWKNFIDEDLPMLTPEQTYQVQPLPEFVSYQ